MLFILLSLVTYRLARLVSIDEGPLGAMVLLRSISGGYDIGENGLPQTCLGRGITCPHCVGMWIALAVALVAYGWQAETVMYWLAIAGAQSFLQGLTR